VIAAFLKVHIKPGKKEKLLEYLKWDCQVARDDEPATLRFDVFEDPSDDGVVYVYEAFADLAGNEAHKLGEPFKTFAKGLKDECIESLEEILPEWTEANYTTAERKKSISMIAAFIKTNVRPGKKEKLLANFKWETQVARDDNPGVLRFDVFEDPNDDNVLYYYEAYVDQAAYELHRSLPPFQKWANGLKEECVESNEPIFMPGLTPVCTTAE
jgi:(4S)-4-hydroxy-5-phosphonooxypentane-2,3-dione isomerase